MKILRGLAAFSAAMILAVLSFGTSPARIAADAAVAQNMAGMKFINFSALPTCAKGAVLNGDPMHGPSLMVVKFAAGCSVPWHWHTANERVMMASGVGVVQMNGGKPVALRPGGYAFAPAQHVHRFRCSGPCTIFILSDGAFDIHYVGSHGQEISPEAALKAVRERPAPGM